MAFAYVTILRAAQAFVAFLVLCLMGYVVHNWSAWAWSPSQANFLLFNGVWTLLAVAYLVVAPLKFPSAAHKFAILGVEAVTLIFWFAGWVALAVLLGDSGCGRVADVCKVAEAATVFGAIEWILFVATTIMAALHVNRNRGTYNNKHDPAMEVHASV